MKIWLHRTVRAAYLAGGLSVAAAGVGFACHVIDPGGVPSNSAAGAVCGAVCGTGADEVRDAPPVHRSPVPHGFPGAPRRAETVAGGLGMSAKPFGVEQLGGHLHGGLPGDVVSPKDLLGQSGSGFA